MTDDLTNCDCILILKVIHSVMKQGHALGWGQGSWGGGQNAVWGKNTTFLIF
jgi:hypothetical protein